MSDLWKRQTWVGCLGLVLTLPTLPSCQTKSENKTAAAPPAAKVVLAAIEERPLIEERSFFGEVRAASDASLSPAESGLVTRVHVVEGNHVKKGDVLVELDDHLARAQLSEALANKKQTSAQKEQAQLELDRFEKMREEQIVSELEAARKQSEAQTLDAEIEGNRAKIEQGTELVRRHRITAPFDGTVVTRNVDPGDWLNAGELALQLLTAQHVEVEVRVPGNMLDRLDHVSKVEIRGERESERVVAQVASAVDALDPKTRTALLRLTPTEPVPWLRVGASVTSIFYIQRSDGTTVPRDAIVYGVAGTRVFKEEAGKATPIDVELIATSRTDVLVRSGALDVGTQVVIRGNERLRPGQAISEKDALVPAAPEP